MKDGAAFGALELREKDARAFNISRSASAPASTTQPVRTDTDSASTDLEVHRTVTSPRTSL
ncbi:MAG TPA: hypothetical protein DDX19_18175 [Rhodopirellula baltica]|nr:hypothetical protein [Rhodopirellula baltica]